MTDRAPKKGSGGEGEKTKTPVSFAFVKEQCKTWRGKVIFALAVILSCYQLYTSAFGLLTPMLQRSYHLAIVCAIVFFLKPSKFPAIDISLAVLSAVPPLYLTMILPNYIFRAGEVFPMDIVAALILLLVLLEATRRSTGLVLIIIAGVFIAYCFAGPMISGFFGHGGYSLARQVTNQFLGTAGIFSSPLAAAATFVFLFIMFGSLLNSCGAGKAFMELAYAFAGRYRGGPGKIAVISSALFGTISGAPVACVATTGAFTIPLMKDVGYRPHVAAAIEAVSATGGSIMPPVMGAAAFIMAELTTIPYYQICIAAAIPAILYYVAVFFSVDNESGRTNLKGLPKEMLPSVKSAISNSLIFFIPFGVMLFMLVVLQVSATKAGMFSLLAIVLTSLILPSSKFNLDILLRAFVSASKGTVTVTLATATAGIIVGVVGQTGLGLKFTTVLVNVAANSSLVLLLLTFVAGVILGMGLPVSAAYIVLATITAPAIVRAGFPVLAAHMFILYVAALAPITPPVALASFTAAAMAGSDAMKTGLTATKIGLASFVVPFMFMYNQELLFIGEPIFIALALLTAVLGVYCLSGGTIGWAFGAHFSWWQRILLIAAAIPLIGTNWALNGVGLAVAIAVIFIAKMMQKKNAPVAMAGVDGEFVISNPDLLNVDFVDADAEE